MKRDEREQRKGKTCGGGTGSCPRKSTRTSFSSESFRFARLPFRLDRFAQLVSPISISLGAFYPASVSPGFACTRLRFRPASDSPGLGFARLAIPNQVSERIIPNVPSLGLRIEVG